MAILRLMVFFTAGGLGLCFFVIFALAFTAVMYTMILLNPKEEKPYISGSKDPFVIGRHARKDVDLNELMTLQSGVYWSKNSTRFTDYHMIFAASKFETECTKLGNDKTQCDTEEVRVFRWEPAAYLTPAVDCLAYDNCRIRIPTFKSNYTSIPFDMAGTFPIDKYIKSRKRFPSKAYPSSVAYLRFSGPARRRIWWKPLFLYIQGHATIYSKGNPRGEEIHYEHTVTLEVENGILDAIYGLTEESIS
ncbi:hypothetical protein DSO57_1000136 [Entomophthora muscae]|uniref:Uncharacterized protein n=1 Tax=Entomophthora muscae TaxID=34485 RepID=A0ACC2SN14_9FUNG|nr:hypothetical protein DSO57_1000136 [Entomophthora muscae]